MDDILDGIVRASQRCERAAAKFDAEAIENIRSRLREAVLTADRAWSGSWLGYHSRIYIEDLQPKRPGEHFDSEWGSIDIGWSSRTNGRWAEYDYSLLVEEIKRRSGVTDWTPLDEAARDAGDAFQAAKDELLPSLDALLASRSEESLQEVRNSIAKLQDHFSAEDFVRARVPTHHFTRDPRAQQGQIQTPAHIYLESWLLSQLSYGNQAAQLGKLARRAARYLEITFKLKGKSVAKRDGKIFIGHGRSRVWQDLRDFIRDRLHLSFDEFNREPTAGLSTKERLQKMLDDAVYAFIVLTGDDEHVDGTLHARENAIHEAGLFQGRLGFERAIVLLEEGCSEFSNHHGITHIRFPKGNITAVSEEIRRVLEREGIK